eukprot:c20961_g1_i3 orf=206-1096(-)
MSDLKAALLRPCPRMHEASPPPTGPQPVRPFSAIDLKKRGHGIRHWIRIDKFGNSQVLEVDKMAIMRRCELPPRDLRLLDPLFVYPSTILGREKAIVVNLEQIRCVITADEVLLLQSLDSHVLQYVTELQRRLKVEKEAQGSKRHVSMHSHAGSFDSSGGHVMPALQRFRLIHQGDFSLADCLPFEFRALEVALEGTCTFLDSQLKQYIDDTEDFINIQLDNVRNQLIQFELLLTTATFVVAIYGVVAGVFGMNIEIGIFNEPRAFKWVILIAGVCGLLIFFCFLLFFKRKGLMPL